MSAQGLWDRGVAWAGLALGATAWAVNQLGNYAAVPWICAHRVYFTPFVALALAATALAGSLLSWRTWRVAPSGDQDGQGGTPAHLLAGMSALIGILFAILILTQGAAALFLDGCER
jgi:hypothetical protein